MAGGQENVLGAHGGWGGERDNAQPSEKQPGLLCVAVVLGELVGFGGRRGSSGHGGMMSVGSCLDSWGRNGDLSSPVMEVQVNPGVRCRAARLP